MSEQEVYCRRCRKHVPISECVVIDPDISAGNLSDQLPVTIHVRKHRRCKERIWLPGVAPKVETHTRLP